MELKGKAALVTGGAVRLGRAIALALAGRGADVAITYHTSAASAERAAAELGERGAHAVAVRCDQRHDPEVRRAVGEVTEAFGRLDVLVNSAAVFQRTPWPALDEATWDLHLETNLKGPYLFCLHAAPALRAGEGGKIINLADVAGLRPWKEYLPYSVSKAGLIALTQGMAKLLAPEVQVNAIAPGVVLWAEGTPAAQREAALARVPLRRAGTSEDVARTVLYLIEGTDYVTGAVIPVDGGRAIS